MKNHRTSTRRKFFEVVMESGSAQAAMMTLRPGQSSSDEPENEHPKAEQWVFVVAGIGRAIVGKRRAALKEGSLLLIGRNERHQISNTGKSPLVTVNLYMPGAYDRKGNVRRSVKG